MSATITDSINPDIEVRFVPVTLPSGYITTALSAESLTKFNFEIPSESELYKLSSKDLKELINKILLSDGLDILLASGQINFLRQASSNDTYITKPINRSIVPVILEYKTTRDQIRASMGQFPPFDLAEQERELMPQIRAILDDPSNKEFVSSYELSFLAKCRRSADVQHCSLDFYSMRVVRREIFPQIEKRKAFNADVTSISSRIDSEENIAAVMPDIIQAVKQVSEFKEGDLYPFLDSNLKNLRVLISGLPEEGRTQFCKVYIDFLYKESRLRQAQYASKEAENNLLDILLATASVNQDSIIDTLEDAMLCKNGIRLTGSLAIQKAVQILLSFSESKKAFSSLERFYSYFSGVNREFLGNAELIAQVENHLITKGSSVVANIAEQKRIEEQARKLQQTIDELTDKKRGLQKIIDRLSTVNKIRELWNKGVLPLKTEIEDKYPDLVSMATREFGAWKTFLE